MIISSLIAAEWVQLLKPNHLKKPTVFGEFITLRTFYTQVSINLGILSFASRR